MLISKLGIIYIGNTMPHRKVIQCEKEFIKDRVSIGVAIDVIVKGEL